MNDQLVTCEIHDWWYYQDLQEECPECVAEKRERERIIALLQAEHSEWTAQHQENKRVYIDDCSACFAIALIKGEQN